MSKEQRIVFVISEAKDGKLKVDLSFHPKLAPNDEKLNQMTLKQRAFQQAAAQIGKHVMEALKRGKTNGGTLEEGKIEGQIASDARPALEAPDEKGGETVNGI